MAIKKFKVLISDNLAKEGIELLKKKGLDVIVNTKLSPENLIKEIPDYDGLIIRSGTKVTKEVVEAAKNLKVIARAGAGYNNIDVEECSKHGIVVLITPTGNTIAVVELTLGLMLSWARNISPANNSLKTGKWEKNKYQGTELCAKVLGIVGFGRIGQGVAKRAQSFEMKVLAHDNYIPKSKAKELGVKLYDNLDDMLKLVDYLSLHVPLTEKTLNLIDIPQFEIMKETAVIVNAARGEVINEKALYEALKEGKIGGACIDVFSSEPANYNNFPFIELDNVLTTPHLGASSKEAQINVATLAADHVAKALKSNIFIDAVNLPFKLPEHLAEVYKPYMELGQYLGKFSGNAIEGRINKVIINYRGEDFSTFEPIQSIILYSIFKDKMNDIVTYMNLERLIKENGINVEINRLEKKTNLMNLIKIILSTEENKEFKITGTVFSGRPKFMEINENYIDISPSDYMLILKSIDRPGVIGEVGSFLGNKGINIAGWQLGRDSHGSKALSVITLDDPLNEHLVAELIELEYVTNAQFIVLK